MLFDLTALKTHMCVKFCSDFQKNQLANEHLC